MSKEGIIPANTAYKMTYGDEHSAFDLAEAVVNTKIREACEKGRTYCVICDNDIPCIARESIHEELVDKGYLVDVVEMDYSPDPILFRVRWR